MTKILWVGPPCDLATTVERASFDLTYVDSRELPERDWGAIVVTSRWPAEVPLPVAPIVFCLPAEELAALDPELIRRAAAILVNPVKPSALLRELESLFGAWWDFCI